VVNKKEDHSPFGVRWVVRWTGLAELLG